MHLALTSGMPACCAPSRAGIHDARRRVLRRAPASGQSFASSGKATQVGESERREKSRATDRAARDHSEAELGSARVKTARLKAERLAKEADQQPPQPETPARAKTRTRKAPGPKRGE
jgi:hypothetical protein